MSMRLGEMIKNAKKPIKLNANTGDNVLIVADTNTNSLVWQALAAAAYDLETEPTIAIMTPRPMHQYDPTTPIAEAIKNSDLNLMVTSTAIIHSPALIQAEKMGRKCMAMEEITPEMLIKGGVTADYEKMQVIGKKMRSIWTKGKTVRVTSELGTDLIADVTGRPGFYVAGVVQKQPGIDMYAAAFPDGEAGISPLEGTGEGIIVFDTSIHHVGLIKEPIKVIVKKGRAVHIQGGIEAKLLREVIEKYGDENTYNCPAEISIGINPKSRITGVMREDKKLLGSVHIALGTSYDTGGTIKSKLHIDGTIRYPTVSVDENIIVDKGRLFT